MPERSAEQHQQTCGDEQDRADARRTVQLTRTAPPRHIRGHARGKHVTRHPTRTDRHSAAAREIPDSTLVTRAINLASTRNLNSPTPE
jgi:hypothetical protein